MTYQVIVYRDTKYDNIVRFDIPPKSRVITQDAVDKFNLTAKEKAELVEVEEGTLLDFAIQSKRRSVSDYLSDLTDLQNDIESIADYIRGFCDEINSDCDKGGDGK
ncbi:MAG: hypothetical protein J5958_06680 [Clostridia bacterium]|nr:hypothetical protein [Clostridia bacterium]